MYWSILFLSGLGVTHDWTWHYLQTMTGFLWIPAIPNRLCFPDLIFTLFSEEFGFFGSLLILFLYALIVARIVKIGNQTRSNFGKLYCYSFATAFFIYVIVNMMMVLGLLPIVGSPLPIMSYGGSSMMAMMLGLGIVMSFKIYKDLPVN